jgi:integrase
MGRNKSAGVSVVKNGVCYLARWWDGTNKIAKSVGVIKHTTKATAVERANAMYSEYIRSAATRSGAKPECTLRQWIEIHRSEASLVLNKTHGQHLAAAEYFAQCVGDDIRLRDVGPQHVRDFAAWLAGKQNRSVATVATIIVRTKRVFELAKDRNPPLIDANPFAGNVGKELAKIYRTDIKHPHKHVSMEDFNILLKTARAAKTDHPWPVALMALCRLAGMRRVEAKDVQWDDVDWKRGCITVRAATDEAGRVRNSTKRAYRVVPMTQELASILREIQSAGSTKPCHGCVVETAEYATINRIIVKSGLAGYGKPLQALRASWINDMMDNGYAIQDIAEWAGHSIVVMMQHYRERDAGRRIEAFHNVNK